MASILLCSSPTLGHVAPLVAVARHLVGSGHRVRFLTGTRYEATVAASGAEFIALPAEADIHLDDPAAAFPARARLRGLALVRFDILNLFLAPVPAQAEALQQAITAEKTDAVLTEGLFLASAALLGLPRSRRPALIGLGVVPLAFDAPDLAPMGFGLPPLGGPVGRIRNRALAFAARRAFAPVFAEGERLLAQSGLDGIPGGFDWLTAADAVAQFTVPGFEYPRAGLPTTVQFVGPVARTVPSDAPLPPWWSRLSDGRPVVHVTQGTVANKQFDELIAPTIEGLAGQDVHVVVSTGRRPVDELPAPLPANVLAAEFLPYDRLLPLTDVMVTNGGYGGVHYALEHGVPLVVAGMTEDKMEVSARVAWSGAGINLRTNRPRPRRISDAVRTLLADDRYRRASARLAAEIAVSPGVAGVERIVLEQLGARRPRHP